MLHEIVMYEQGKINALEEINGIVLCLQRIKKVNAHMEENQCWNIQCDRIC